MKKKSLLLFILTFILVGIVSFALTGCSKSCEHNWQDIRLITPATCIDDGIQEQQCSKCKELQEVTLPKLNHDFKEWKTNSDEHWYECSHSGCSEVSNKGAHEDTDKNHKCDECLFVMSSCSDTNKDHKCDLCESKLSDCSDDNEDHICDLCESKLSDCSDINKDHICDLCESKLSDCSDTNKDHKCDLCESKLSDCSDDNKDHKCDLCDSELSKCVDTDFDHMCDLCSIELNHIFDGEWEIDSINHYHICSREECNEKGDVEKHNFVNGICDTCEVKNTFATEGLVFEYDSNTSSYTVKGYTGEVLDVLIPYFYDDGVNGEHIVTAIGDYAFANGEWDYKKYSNNNNITSVTIADSIVSIGQYAFIRCGEITSVVIPDSVTQIGTAAFSNCKKLSEFTLSKNIEVTGGSVFYMTEWYTNQPDGLIYIDKFLYLYKGNPTEAIDVVVKEGTVGIFGEAFYAKNISSVTFPDSLVWIGKKAFQSCKLSTINYGSGLKIIQNSGFYNCVNLTSIIIPESLEVLENSAFANCLGAYEVTLTNPNIKLGNYIFSSAGAKLPENTTLEINLPEGITEITSGMFSGAGMTEIKIPSTVTSIGYGAFRQCYSLKTFTVGPNVTSIGEFAFGNCTALEEITIHENLEVISDEAFFRCLNLKSITLPWTLEEIRTKSLDITEDHWFTTMDKEFIIYYDGGSFKPYHSKVEEDCTNDGTVEYWEEILTGKTFSDSNCYYEITDIVIPAGCKGGVATCEEKAICINCGNEYGEVLGHSPTAWKYDKDNHWKECNRTDCSNHLDVGSHDFVDGICTICKGYNIFGTEGLEYEYYFGMKTCRVDGYSGTDKDVIIPEYFKDPNGRIYQVTIINSDAFENNTTIESIVIPSTITEIGMVAFSECINLKEVTLPASTIEFKSRAFENCTSLNKVNIESVESWFDYTFSSREANPLYYAHNLYVNGQLVTEVVVPEGITKLKEYSFLNATIQSVSFPSTLQRVDYSVFNGCKSLNRVDVLTLKQWLSISFNEAASNPLYYGKHLYIGGELLTDLVVPDDITRINNYAFINCVDLKTVVIPNTVTNYGSSIFRGCSSIEEMTLPYSGFISGSYVSPFGYYFGTTEYENSVGALHENKSTYYLPATLKTVNITGEEIVKEAFFNCSSISKITFDNAKKIGENAFEGCEYLYSITLPETLEEIGTEAFEYCYRLVEIYNYSSLELTPESSDFGKVALRALRIVSDYSPSKVTTDENGFAYYTDGDEVRLIGYTENERYITLPNNITYINKYALANNNCVTVTVNEGVTTIGSSAFNNCSQLTQIYLPDSLEVIEGSAFYGVYNITSITLPKNLKSIKSGAFYSAIKLVEIVNLSSLQLEIGKDSNGGVARNALAIVTSASDSKISVDENGYLLYTTDTEVMVVGYIGSETDITIPTNVTSINDYAFFRNMYITSVTIPGNVKSIKREAFSDCVNLKDVILEEGIEEIGLGAFSDNEALTGEVVIPGSVKTVGVRAFSFSNLKTLRISSGVETLDEEAFLFCDNIITIYIPKSVTTINESCFAAVNFLKVINYEGTVEEWNSINKSSLLGNIPSTTIINCSDMSIDRAGNVVTPTN